MLRAIIEQVLLTWRLIRDPRVSLWSKAIPVLAIARKARSADPGARYQSVQALSADVSRYLAGRAVEAHRETLVDRLARFERRYRLPILLVLTYLAVRALMLWFVRV